MTNWKNIVERLVSTTWQAAVGALAGALATVDLTHGVVGWQGALVTVGTAAALSFAKNLQQDLTPTPVAPGAAVAVVVADEKAPVVNTTNGPVTVLK